MTPLSLSAMWHCVLATFQTRHDINNDARQHPDTNFSRSTSSLFFFSPKKKLVKFALCQRWCWICQTTQSWMKEPSYMYKCYACLHVDTTRAVEALIYFYIFILSLPAVVHSQTRNTYFFRSFILFRIKKMTRRTIGDNFAMPQHKVHVWHFFKLPFNSEKCFHHKKK